MKIISTTSNPCEFCFYDKSNPQNPVIIKKIHINGSALVVPQGTRHLPFYSETVISKEDYEMLKDHPVFKRKVKNGYLKVVGNLDKSANEDMEKKDGGAQLLTEEFPVNDGSGITDVEDTEKSKGKKYKVAVKTGK